LLAPFAFGQSQFRTGVRVFNRLLRRLMHIDGGGRQLRLSNGETVFRVVSSSSASTCPATTGVFGGTFIW
jgi:hypothetical protein